MKAQSVLYGKLKNYDTQIIFKTAKLLNLAKRADKIGLAKISFKFKNWAYINGPNPSNRQLRPAHPMTQSTGSDPTIRSNTGLRFIHPT